MFHTDLQVETAFFTIQADHPFKAERERQVQFPPRAEVQAHDEKVVAQ
jgi:hypothetical protein